MKMADPIFKAEWTNADALDLQPTCNQLATDSISRQAAIDAVETKIKKWNAVDGEGYHVGLGLRYTDVIDTLTELPSAQPEIIRCKDCKYWMPHSQLGFDEDNGTYHDYCEKLIPEDEYYAFYRDADDYCSRAERRTE